VNQQLAARRCDDSLVEWIRSIVLTNAWPVPDVSDRRRAVCAESDRVYDPGDLPAGCCLDEHKQLSDD